MQVQSLSSPYRLADATLKKLGLKVHMIRFRREFQVVHLLVVFVAGTISAQDPADLVLRGGKIVTVDDTQPYAQALAARGDRIVAVGSNQQIQPLIGDRTQVIELQGKLAVPGFIEGHGHFVGLGQSMMTLDLTRAESWDDIVNQVLQAAQTTPRGEWIVGRGWHQSKWLSPPEPNVDGYPVHTRLSQATPYHPVLLEHASGHMSFANQMAMDLAGVDSTTPDPSGGEILHDEDRNPIGVFRESAQALVDIRRSTPEQQRRDLLTAIGLASEECLRRGITSFQDAGSSFDTIDVFRRLAEQGELKVRLWVMVRDSAGRLAELLPASRTIGAGDNFLTVRAIKQSMDGALGAHGAWLLKPYTDLPSSTGLNTTPISAIRQSAKLAVEHDFQLCVHAIGDRANREVLNIFEETFLQHRSEPSPRWRIEHAQHLHPSDIPRFAGLGVIASMQGVHCTSDGVFVIDRLGPQRAQEGAYVWHRLLNSGAVVINGTDAPVEALDPLASIYASVTRRLADGSEFFPEQRMTREQALRSYTINTAYAAFEDELKGSLTPGKLADVVVLSKDILTCPADEIPRTKVVYTIVAGQVVFEDSSSANE